MSTAHAFAGRSHVLLAPRDANVPSSFRTHTLRPTVRQRYMDEMQRLRGNVYLKDGAITPSSLTFDGRHVSPYDERSWHLLSLNGVGEVVGCARVLIHSATARFDDLLTSLSSIARCPQWGEAVRETVERELRMSRKLGVKFCEAGGWAVRHDVRCSPHAVRLALSVFAFARLTGGAIALTTATLRNHSAAILRRLGGRPLVYNGSEVPLYYDPQYACEMALLRFDTQTCAPRFESTIMELRSALEHTPVLCAEASSRPAIQTARRTQHAFARFALASSY